MILVMACGNRLRRDDGAGLLLAEKLERLFLGRRLKVRRIAVQQLTPELAEIIACAEVSEVVFVDARFIATGGDKHKIEVQQLYVGIVSPSFGHHMDPAALMLYTCHLYNKKPHAWKISVPGSDFGHGEGLSGAARQAISEAADEVAAKMMYFFGHSAGSENFQSVHSIIKGGLIC